MEISPLKDSLHLQWDHSCSSQDYRNRPPMHWYEKTQQYKTIKYSATVTDYKPRWQRYQSQDIPVQDEADGSTTNNISLSLSSCCRCCPENLLPEHQLQEHRASKEALLNHKYISYKGRLTGLSTSAIWLNGKGEKKKVIKKGNKKYLL